MKLRDQLEQLRASAPKLSAYGQRYAKVAETKGKHSRIVLHTMFVSNENTHMIRPHVFSHNNPLTAKQWHAWLAKHSTRVYLNGILPGMAIRTGKQWSVQHIIGWTIHVKPVTHDAVMDDRRHKAKSQR